MNCLPTNPCKSYPDAKCITYTGTDLPCIGAKTNDRLDTILIKIDAKLCTISSNAYTFGNGITELNRIVHLGGDLIEDTLITLQGFSFTLGGPNIYLTSFLNTTGTQVLTTDENGLVQLVDISTFPIECSCGFQDVLDNDNVLTKDNIIETSGFDFTFNEVGTFTVDAASIIFPQLPNSDPTTYFLTTDGTGIVSLKPASGTAVPAVPVLVSTTAAIPASTYSNGTAGVGATLTGNVNGAFPTTDGRAVPVTSKILVRHQASQLQNGVYILTQAGDGSTPFILTRSVTADTTGELYPEIISVSDGTLYGGSIWQQITVDPVVGTNNIVYVPFSVSYFAQTWQQTLITGSTLTQNNTVIGAGTDFTFSDLGIFTLDSNEIHITLPTAAGYVLTDVAGNGNLTLQPIITSSWRTILTAGESGTQQLAAGATTYVHVTGIGSMTANLEVDNQFIIPDDCTAENLFVKVSGTQPLTGSLVITVRKNLVNTALAITIAAGATTGVYSDTVSQVTFVAGDIMTVQVHNNASSAAISFQSSGISLFHT